MIYRGGLFQKKISQTDACCRFCVVVSSHLLPHLHPPNVAIGRSLGHFRTTWRMDRCRCHSAGMRFVDIVYRFQWDERKGWDFRFYGLHACAKGIYSFFPFIPGSVEMAVWWKVRILLETSHFSLNHEYGKEGYNVLRNLRYFHREWL